MTVSELQHACAADVSPSSHPAHAHRHMADEDVGPMPVASHQHTHRSGSRRGDSSNSSSEVADEIGSGEYQESPTKDVSDEASHLDPVSDSGEYRCSGTATCMCRSLIVGSDTDHELGMERGSEHTLGLPKSSQWLLCS